MKHFTTIAGQEVQNGLRVDRYVAEILQLFSRSQVKARKLTVKVNRKDVKISHLILPGDTVDLTWENPPPATLIPQEIPLSILYEDDSVIVINKPQGLVVHPGAGNWQGTLANALLYRRLSLQGESAVSSVEDLSDNSTMLRPGIVHRLDKDTSGVLIAGYTEQAHAFLADQFKNRQVKKTYLGIVKGVLVPDKGSIETYIVRDPHDRKRFTWSKSKGKLARTSYTVIRRYTGYTFVALHPKTGRTHQLRVHMKYLGFPIVGDPLYASKDERFPGSTLMLHAWRLSITLPGNTLPSTFTAPLPPRFKKLLAQIK
jgi:23S rRNA pseudouridine1911/1915/1917 synthase